MNADLSGYTEFELSAAVGRVIEEVVKPPELSPCNEPLSFLLGGQSGAGKTILHKIFRERLATNAIVINGDEYRRTHPHYEELQAVYGRDAISHTRAWAGAMVEHLVDALSRASYNLIVEGTLRTAEVPLRTAALLRSRGYSVSLALLAVKPEISLVSCQIRFEQMRLLGTVPRSTDPAYHNGIVHDIVDNLAVLEQSSLFDEIYIYDRMERCIFPSGIGQEEPDGAGFVNLAASEVLREKLFGAWTEQEKAHLAFLEHQLAALREL